ncbi:LysR family transcriptional regulator [Xanthobacter agilis]|uniref:DNA-binding transcriptional LysR family regulator n=1 Tax=Xanthobacter agilis TaxID=47492 RepID=A0ABU0LD29_XANAG|nr:LysR family transcriptional regulator [Xanthobacter agilis]MDQ0505007.1 DNA-binding transcriptional LysR family regulator [Xanthobacter agilis]
MAQVSRRSERASAFTRNVDWNLFRTFLEIVEWGGISAAARAMNRQQPSISAALRRLEGHLGVELCERSAKGVELTAAGNALFDLCAGLRAQVNRMPLEVAKANGLVDGAVRIRMISDLVSPLLDRAIADFHVAFPGVELRLEVAPWRAIIKSLRTGDAEIGITCDSAPNMALQYVPVMREIQQLYCGPGHPCHGSAPLHPAELRHEGFILTGEDEPDELEHFRRRYGLGARTSGFAETLAEVRRLILLGVGLGFLPTDVANRERGDAACWPLLAPELLPSYEVYVVARASESLSTPARLGQCPAALHGGIGIT